MANIHLTTDKGRLNYPYVFKPREEEDDKDARYTIDFLISKKNREGVDALKKAIWEAIVANKEFLKLKGPLRDIDDLPESFNYPLKNGDRKNNAGEEYEGCYYITPWSKDKPGVVGPNPKQEIRDSNELYSGCYIRISISIGVFDFKGKRGLSIFLNNIQKLAEGERLDNRRSAFQDFDDGFAEEGGYDDKPKRRGSDDFDDDLPKKRCENDDDDRPRKRREDDQPTRGRDDDYEGKTPHRRSDDDDDRPNKRGRSSWLD